MTYSVASLMQLALSDLRYNLRLEVFMSRFDRQPLVYVFA